MKTRIPTDPNKRRVWIKHELEKLGHTYASIARDKSVSRQAVHKAIGHSSPKMEQVIACYLGRKPQEIWPERYAKKRRQRRVSDRNKG